jgi:hypothetical protein
LKVLKELSWDNDTCIHTPKKKVQLNSQKYNLIFRNIGEFD